MQWAPSAPAPPMAPKWPPRGQFLSKTRPTKHTQGADTPTDRCGGVGCAPKKSLWALEAQRGVQWAPRALKAPKWSSWGHFLSKLHPNQHTQGADTPTDRCGVVGWGQKECLWPPVAQRGACCGPPTHQAPDRYKRRVKTACGDPKMYGSSVEGNYVVPTHP